MKPAIRIDSSHPVVARLIEFQGDASDKQFSEANLQISPTVWYRLKRGEYQAADHTRVLRKITADLSELLDSQSITGSIKSSRILPLSHILEARDALNLAFAEDRNRLVISLADTGGGKTMIAKSITRDFPTTTFVEATESWRKSYLAGISSISHAAKIEDLLRNNTRLDEQTLINQLAANPRIIVIDEGNYFGPACLNLVKAILNQTECVVVILAMPLLWKTITKNNNQEARQLRNRAAAILEFNVVKLDDVAIAMSESLPNWTSLEETQPTAIREVAAAANNFGLWNTVFSIANFIGEEAGDESLTLGMVREAIADVTKLRKG